LISVRGYTKIENEVLFTSGGDIIKNLFNKNEIKIHLVNDQYYVDLNDVDNKPMANMLCSKITMRIRLLVIELKNCMKGWVMYIQE
jgi:hypothetical protein